MTSDGAFDTILGALSSEVMALKIQVIVFVVLGTVALVLLSLLLDLVKKYIRGLDTALLGGILILAAKIAADHNVIKAVTDLLYLIAGTLIVTGIIIFIISLSVRRKRKARQAEKEREIAERDRAAKAVLNAHAQAQQAQAQQAARVAQSPGVPPVRR